MTGDDGLVEAIAGGDHASLSPADRVLLEFAALLTERPGSVSAQDIEKLRAAGFDDRAIHDACQVVAYFAYVNRVADGLGVELEEEPRGGD